MRLPVNDDEQPPHVAMPTTTAAVDDDNDSNGDQQEMRQVVVVPNNATNDRNNNNNNTSAQEEGEEHGEHAVTGNDDQDQGSPTSNNNNDDTESIVDGEHVSLAEAVYTNGRPAQEEDTSEEARERRSAERGSAIGWFLLFLFFVHYQLLPSNTTTLDPASTAPANHSSDPWKDYRVHMDKNTVVLVFYIPLALLVYVVLTRGYAAVPILSTIKAFACSYLAAFWMIIPISTICAALLIGIFSIFLDGPHSSKKHSSTTTTTQHSATVRQHSDFGGAWNNYSNINTRAPPPSTVHNHSNSPAAELFALAAQLFTFLLCCEVGKLHFFETIYSRARTASPPHYVYHALAVALGFATLECTLASSLDNALTSFLYMYPTVAERHRVQNMWWVGFCFVSITSHVLTAYLLSLATARRDMRLLSRMEEAMEAARTENVSDEELRTRFAVPDEQKPIRRPFSYSVMLRFLTLAPILLLMANYFDVFPEKDADRLQHRISSTAKVGVPICIACSALTLVTLLYYCIGYEALLIPESYKRSTGRINELFVRFVTCGLLERIISVIVPSLGAPAATGGSLPFSSIGPHREQQAQPPQPEAAAATAREPGAPAGEEGAAQQPTSSNEHHSRRAPIGTVVSMIELARQREEREARAEEEMTDEEREERRQRREQEQREVQRRRPENVFVVGERPPGYAAPSEE